MRRDDRVLQRGNLRLDRGEKRRFRPEFGRHSGCGELHDNSDIAVLRRLRSYLGSRWGLLRELGGNLRSDRTDERDGGDRSSLVALERRGDDRRDTLAERERAHVERRDLVAGVGLGELDGDVDPAPVGQRKIAQHQIDPAAVQNLEPSGQPRRLFDFEWDRRIAQEMPQQKGVIGIVLDQ